MALRYLRYLPEAESVYLAVDDPESLRRLIQISFPGIQVIDRKEADGNCADITYDLAKLPLLLKSLILTEDATNIRIPYLDCPPFQNGGAIQADTICIGIALYGPPEAFGISLKQLVHVLPLTIRNNATFLFFPASLKTPGPSPTYFRHIDVAEYADDYAGIASWVQQVDIMIGFENDVTHLAGAFGKMLWLIAENEDRAEFLCSNYPTLTFWKKHNGQNLLSLLESLFLYRAIMPSELTFKDFNLQECRLPGELKAGFKGFPDVDIESTDKLATLFDLDVTAISSVSIETTTVCNLRCSYCPHSTIHAKPPEYMPEEIFYRIVDSFKEYLPDYAGEIIPSMYGEPLLDKRLETFVAYIRRQFPKSVINLFTNGHYLTIERYHRLLEAGVSFFRISLHQEKLLEVVEHTLAEAAKTQANLNNIEIIPMYYSEDYFNRGGVIEAPLPDPSLVRQMIRCASGFSNIAFNWKGQAILCCNDYCSRHVFGSIEKNSVREIWHSPIYNRIRNKLLFGFLPLPICRTCTMHDSREL